jgi:hypothetical protein
MVSNWLTPGTGSANLRAGQAIGDSKRAKNGAVIGMRAKRQAQQTRQQSAQTKRQRPHISRCTAVKSKMS